MGALKGRLGHADWIGVKGWAHDVDSAGTPVALEVIEDGRLLAAVVADQPRPGLTQLPETARRCGFSIRFPVPLDAFQRHVIHVRRSSDGAELPNSPWEIEPSQRLDAGARATIGTAVAARIEQAQEPGDLDAPIRFLVAEAERLLQARQERFPDRQQAPSLPNGWTQFLKELGALNRQPALGGDAGRRALVIGEVPLAAVAGNRLLSSRIESLARIGFAVGYAAMGAMEQEPAAVPALSERGIVCYGMPFYPSVEEVLRQHRDLFDVILLRGVRSVERYGWLCRHYCSRARLVFDVDRLNFVALARRAAIQKWPQAAAKSGELQIRERLAAWMVDAALTASAFEATLLGKLIPRIAPRPMLWPMTVRADGSPFDDRRGLAFVGDCRQHTEADAASWLLQDILPAARQADPSIACTLVTPGLPEDLAACCQEAGVETRPPRDAAQVLGQVRLTVAPWRYGAGVKGAVLDSLAAGIPCVVTPVCAEGLALPETLNDLVCADPETMARTICRLHNDAAWNETLGKAGQRFVAETLTPERIDRTMRDVVGVPSDMGRQAADHAEVALAGL